MATAHVLSKINHSFGSPIILKPYSNSYFLLFSFTSSSFSSTSCCRYLFVSSCCFIICLNSSLRISRVTVLFDCSPEIFAETIGADGGAPTACRGSGCRVAGALCCVRLGWCGGWCSCARNSRGWKAGLADCCCQGVLNRFIGDGRSSPANGTNGGAAA